MITINGVIYEGNNIVVSNNVVTINGVTVENVANPLVIKIEGDLATLKSDGNVTVEGNVNGSVTCAGNLRVHGEISGDVTCTGNIRCR